LRAISGRDNRMITRRAIILLLAITAVVTAYCLPCRAEQVKDEQDIWRQEEPGRPRPGPEIGPGPGPDRPRGPEGPERFELTDEEIDRIMISLKKSDPEKAKELQKLRKEDPKKFHMELRRYGRDEFGKIMQERIETWRQKRQADFLQWLGKDYPKAAENLAKLKEKEPNHYIEKFDYIRKKYWHIFEEDKRNPELAEVLKEDLQLKEEQDELLRRIKAAKGEKDREKLAAELEEVTSKRFDLIVRRKEIAYERLLKWLEELRKRVKENRDEIAKWRDEKFKAENVKKRLKDLTEGIPEFKWD